MSLTLQPIDVPGGCVGLVTHGRRQRHSNNHVKGVMVIAVKDQQ